MARPTEGWKLRRHARTGIYFVRFSIDSQRFEYSTGQREREAASVRAGQIYAATIAGQRRRRSEPKVRGNLGEAVAAWITDTESTRDKYTNRSYITYFRAHLIPFFDNKLERITTDNAVRYRDMRLRTVKASSVRKELSALRGLLGWLESNGLIVEAPVIKPIPRKMTGTAYHVKRRQSAVELSPAEARAFLAALPRDSGRGYPVRARFAFQYESGLRWETLNELKVPDNYVEGRGWIRLFEEDDKGRFNRDVLLSPKAKLWIDSACRDQALVDGNIFPYRDLRCHWQKAAKKALPPDKAERFDPPALRAARVTHWLERTQNIPGVMHQVGHKQATTTNRYVKPSLRAAEAMLKDVSRKRDPRA